MAETLTSNEFNFGLISIKLASAEPPAFVEARGDTPYIKFGEKNDYPYYLIDLFRRSVMHSTIIDGKVRYICGQGWSVDKTGLQTTEYASLVQILNSPQGTNDLAGLTNKIVYDLEMFDGFALEIIYNNSGSKIAEVNHVPFENVRSNKDNSEFYYTSAWFKINSNGSRSPNSNFEKAEDYTIYQPYDPENRTGKQLLYYKCYSPGLDVYPLPKYLSAITNIETEVRISNFWLNAIKNGFAGSYLLSFNNGIPTADEQKKIKEQIKKELTGDEAAGNIVIEFNKNPDLAAKVNPLNPSDLDKQYQQLKETVQQNIITAHSVTNPTLVSIQTPGKLGTANEIQESVQLFQNWYVTPRQQIVEGIINMLFAPDNAIGRFKLKQLQPIGMSFTEAFLENHLPAQALADLAAEYMGIDLKEYQNRPATTTTVTKQAKFSDCICEMPAKTVQFFEKRGKKRSECKILTSVDFNFESDQQLEASEEVLRLAFDDNQDTPTTGIGTPPSSAKPPIKGTPKAEVIVMYSYEGPNDEKNRAFCADMLALDRLYTRLDMAEINAEIKGNEEYSAAFGDLDINVWKHRGGWYRKPGTDVSIPRCRHNWKQHLVLKA